MKLRLDLSYAEYPSSHVYSSLKDLFEGNSLKKAINIFFEDPENVRLLNENDFDKLACEWADGSSIFDGKAPHYIVDLFLNFLVLCGINVILDSDTIDDLSVTHMRLISDANNKYAPWVEVV